MFWLWTQVEGTQGRESMKWKVEWCQWLFPDCLLYYFSTATLINQTCLPKGWETQCLGWSHNSWIFILHLTPHLLFYLQPSIGWWSQSTERVALMTTGDLPTCLPASLCVASITKRNFTKMYNYIEWTKKSNIRKSHLFLDILLSTDLHSTLLHSTTISALELFLSVLSRG